MDNDQNLYNSLARYFSGELSDAELLLLEKQFIETPESAVEFEKAKRVWNTLNYPVKANKKDISNKTFQKIHRPSKNRFLYRLSAYAAIFLTVALISVSITWFQDSKNENLVTVETTFGEVKNITLQDGTIVWLNANSSISYKEKFSRKERKVFFKGEAFFDVTSDKKHPFIVETNHIIVNVVGTRFNISSYENDPTVQTFLEEGEVNITSKTLNSKHTIKPNQLITFDKAKSKMTITPGDAEKYTSWLNGDLSFYNEKFESIARKLNRKYGVNIIINNEKIKHLKYTAQFKDENIDEILDFLSGTYPMEINFVDEAYYITEKPLKY
ncbi:MAG: FecR family protein [Bacteroidetes bacterium]|nr:FecR family protein [Bacteroidota bacterium]